MKKHTLIILSIMIVVIVSICNSFGLVTMILYGHMIKPTETWYFSRGYDKKLDQTRIKTQISDSCNITKRAIRLVRKDNDTIRCYWVDIDTTYYHDNGIRLKIVDSNGMLLRYLDSWLVPGSENGVDFSSTEFITDKKGNLLIKTDNLEHRIYHSGDMMGLHHFDFQKPNQIEKNATLQFNWNGYSYHYKWLTYEGKREDFYLINEYSFEGEQQDSFYVIINSPNFAISDNHFIKWNDWDYENNNYILNNGKNYELRVDKHPFGGYGNDSETDYLNPVLHSFRTNGYIDNCFNKIDFGYPLKSVDFLRNRKTLQVVNETIKSIGYSKFISKSEFNAKKYGVRGDYLINYNLGYSISDITDSLIFYYGNESAPVYYKEFWSRRELEKLGDYVYQILTDIQKHYSYDENQFKPNEVNDTLKTLLTFDLEIQNENPQNIDKTILDYYDYLTKIGMTQSAYNLIFIDSISQITSIDKEKIYNDLTINKKPYRIDNKTYFLTKNKPKWIDYE